MTGGGHSMLGLAALSFGAWLLVKNHIVLGVAVSFFGLWNLTGRDIYKVSSVV